MKQSRRRVFGVVALLAASVVLAACASDNNSGSTGGGGGTINVTIGMPIAQTGSNAFAGIELFNGAKLAVNQINAANGKVHITLKDADTKGATDSAISAFNQVSAGADLVCGIAFTQEAIALKPFVARYGKPVLLMQATDLSNRSENLYSMSPSQAPLMTAMINTWKDKGIKSFGMIWSDAPFGQQDADAARKAAEGAGITIASDTGVALDATDFSSAISKTVQANPDAILLAALPNQSGLMANKIRALGYTKPLYGQQGDGNATFFKTAGSAVADGYQLYTFWDPAVADATGQKMLDAYKAAYPDAATPSVFAAIGWDAMHIVAQAVEKAGSVDGAKVLEQFKSGTFTGTILGPSLKFGSDGFVSAKGYLVKYNADGTKSKIAAF